MTVMRISNTDCFITIIYVLEAFIMYFIVALVFLIVPSKGLYGFRGEGRVRNVTLQYVPLGEGGGSPAGALKWHSLRSLPFQDPIKSRFQGPPLPIALVMDIACIRIITSRAI